MYVARRYLKLSPQEWGELPWWVQQAYLDGLMQEGVLVSGEGKPEFEEQGDYAPADIDPVMASDSDLRRMGLTVIDGG